MTERKSKQRKIKPAKVVAPLSAITEVEDVTEAQEVEKPSVSDVTPAPSSDETKGKQTKQAKPESKPAPSAKKIVSSPFKGVATRDRYAKVVAITNSRGRFGNQRYQIKDGETYTFSVELAKWLVDTGRAK